MPIQIQHLYRHIFKVWRKRRHELFLRLMEPAPTDIMLDVGGYPGFWLAHPQPVARIDSVNTHEVTWDQSAHPDHRITTLVGDGCALALPDQSYDIGFSNSVIEHVSTWENQQRFAAEILRTSKAVWVQTPAYEFPLEPHYLTPFIHYLPHSVQKKILRRFSVWGLLQHPTQAQVDEMVDTTRLLRRSEMEALFPGCEIHTERVLGIFPKSYIAIRRPRK